MVKSYLVSARRAGSCALIGTFISVSPFAWADDAERIKSLEERLERSQQLIEQLSARLAELERASKAAPAKPATPPADRHDPAPEVARLQESVNQMSASLGQRNGDTGVPLHGFADVGAAWSSGADPAKLRGFSVGTLDLYLTTQVSDRVKALAEIAFEFEQNSEGSVDMERLQLGYTASDRLTLWAGRFHTPFGLWNTSFHHGANLQTSIFRPRFVEFEDKGGIIPAHSVGVWASGRSRLGVSRLTYDVYLSNGPSIRERRLDPNTFTDDTPGKLVGFNLGYLPAGVAGGLTVGLHGFGSTVNAFAPSGAVLNSTRLRAAGAYFGYDADDWESIGEYYAFRNAETADGIGRRSNAAFVHVGRVFGSLTPYVRYERTSLDPQDNYFRSQLVGRSYRRAVVGARYALDPKSSFKVELSTTRESALMQIDATGALILFVGGSYRRAAFQYSLAF